MDASAENPLVPPTDLSRAADNVVDYVLFIPLCDDHPTPSSRLARLQALRKQALGLIDGLAKDYIWYRDGFSLDVVSENGEARLKDADAVSFFINAIS